MKKKMALGMATIMAAGCFQVTAFGANFSDIKDVPWDGAKIYINQAADAKLMVGDIHPVTGKLRFRAREKVSYTEATQLAYSILKNTGKLKDSGVDLVAKWGHVLKSYNIPDWAYPAVGYALENNITTLTEVSHFMEKKGNKLTGKNVNREQVATIFGRALAPYYTINEKPTLIFTDKSAISSESAPYVDLLSRLGILVGDSEKNFSPKVPINRAEMSVLVLKTSDIVKGGATAPITPTVPTPPIIPQTGTAATGTATGTVASVEQYGGNKFLAVNLSNGTRQGFMINESTYVLLKDTTTQMNVSNLVVGDGISVEYNGSAAKVIRLLSDKTINAREITGTIDDLTASKIYVKKSDGKVEAFNLSIRYTLTLDRSASTLKLLTEAYKDAILKVTLTLDSSGVIVGVVATKEAETGKTGILKAISDDEISYRESGSSSTKDCSWGDKIEVYLEGKDSTVSRVRTALKDAKDGELYVKVYLDSRDKVKKALVSKDKFDSKSTSNDFYGTTTSLSEDRISVKKASNNTTEKFSFASSVSYYLDGESSNYRKVNAAYNNAYDDNDDFYVRVLLDSSGKVKTLYASETESKVKGETYKTSKDGELARIDSSEVRVDRTNYDIASGIDYYLEGKSSRLSSIQDALQDAGSNAFYVTIYLDSDGDVIKLEASKSRTKSGRDEDGRIDSMSKTSIKIKGESNINLASSVTITLDDDKISVSDLVELVDDDDIDIKATITVRSDEVIKIEAYTEEAEGRLKDFDTADKTIEIRTEDGTTREYELEDRSVECTGYFNTAREFYIDQDRYDFDVKLDFEKGKVTKVDIEKH